MTRNEQRKGVQKWSETVNSELYDDLLNRYERILVFAGQLQERLRQQKLLADRNQSLEGENERLRQLLANEESYVRLLEHALQSVGVFPRPEEKEK